MTSSQPERRWPEKTLGRWSGTEHAGGSCPPSSPLTIAEPIGPDPLSDERSQWETETYVPASALEKEKAEREAGRKELQATIRRMDEATISALESAGAWEGGVVTSIGLLAQRADEADQKLAEVRRAVKAWQNDVAEFEAHYGCNDEEFACDADFLSYIAFVSEPNREEETQ